MESHTTLLSKLLKFNPLNLEGAKFSTTQMICRFSLCRKKSNRVLGRPFRPVSATPIDLFPHTPHCELVVLLERVTEEEEKDNSIKETATGSDDLGEASKHLDNVQEGSGGSDNMEELGKGLDGAEEPDKGSDNIIEAATGSDGMERSGKGLDSMEKASTG